MDVFQSLTDRLRGRLNRTVPKQAVPKEAVAQNRKSPITDLSPASGAAGQRFAFIDALRGIAALGVAAYHIYHYGPLPKAAAAVTPKFLDVALHHGWMGVQIFFVISGVVIAYALRSAPITPGF